jgi:hypothetical protein
LQAARSRLEFTWKHGFRSPAAAYAYAVALTAEYSKTLAVAERIQDDSLRRARIAAAALAYRQTIDPVLLTARSYAEQPAQLVEARLAFAAGDDSGTTSLAERVIERFPWSNEARLLHADANLRTARTRRMNGDIAGAEREFDHARQELREAAVIAPSDPL